MNQITKINVNNTDYHLPFGPKFYTTTGTQGSSNSSKLACNISDCFDLTDGVPENGTVLAIRLAVATAATYGALLSVDGGTTYRPIVYNAATGVADRYSADSTIILTYNSTHTANGYPTDTTAVSYTGCWQICDHNTNTDNYAYDVRPYYWYKYASTNIYRYQICLTVDDTHVAPINTNSNTSGTTKTSFYTGEFDPFKEILYYSTTSTISAGNKITNGYFWNQFISLDLRYSFNIPSTMYQTYGDWYIVATPQSDGKAKLYFGASGTDYTACLTSSLPTTDDGLIYIYLGAAYDSNYMLTLPIKHPIYYYKDGSLRIWTNSETGGGALLTEITYSELLALRDNSELTPGMQYRITDYECSTTQDNTQSAGHQFDIIVTANSDSELSEDARACLHDGDTYFANCNLEGWVLKYSIDNNTNRYAWASTSGSGVIYYMKDEWGNECEYDFKNIQFKLEKITGWTYESIASLASHPLLSSVMYDLYTSGISTDSSNYQYFYTFSNPDDFSDASLMNGTCVMGNKVGDSIIQTGTDTSYLLPENVFIGQTIAYCTSNGGSGNVVVSAMTEFVDLSASVNNFVVGYAVLCVTIEGGAQDNVLGYYYVQNANIGMFSLGNVILIMDSNFSLSSEEVKIGNLSSNNVVITKLGNLSMGDGSNTCVVGGENITMGYNCDTVVFGSDSTTALSSAQYYKNINIANGTYHVNLSATGTLSDSNLFKNIVIGQGVSNTTITNSEVNQTYETKYVPNNSKTILV